MGSMTSRWWPRSPIRNAAPCQIASRPRPRPWNSGARKMSRPPWRKSGSSSSYHAEPAREHAVDEDREGRVVAQRQVHAPPLAHAGMRDHALQRDPVLLGERPQCHAHAEMMTAPPPGGQPHPRRGSDGTPQTPAGPGGETDPRRRFSSSDQDPAGEEPRMSTKPKGIAARAGHWSARHRKTAIFGWLAFIVIAFVIGGALGQKEPTNAQKMDGETRRAETILENAGFPKKSGEMVLVQSKTETDRRPRLPGRDRRRRPHDGQAADRRQRHQRHRLQGRSLRARPVRPQGRPRYGVDRVAPTLAATKSVGRASPGPDRRAVRRREPDEAARRRRQGGRGRVPDEVARLHADHPRC